MSENKKSKVAQHFTDYRDAYIVGMVGVVSASALFKIKTIDISNVETITAAGIGLAKTVNNIDNSVKIVSNVHPGKVVDLIDEAGNIVASYASLAEAEKILGVARATIKNKAATGALFDDTYKIVINRIADASSATV